jgi:hypothetical protein
VGRERRATEVEESTVMLRYIDLRKEKKQWLLEEMFESRFSRAGGREEG